jgi:Gluconolactonase
MKVEHLYRAQAQLGEGPLWSASGNFLYWLDIRAPAIHRYFPDTGKNETTKMSQGVFSLVETADGGTVGGIDDGLAFIDPITGEFDVIENPLPSSKLRFNDGACDRRGRLWTGSMSRDEPHDPVCTLYMLESDLSVHAMDQGISLSNGIGFSPDDKVMYLSDSIQKTIFAFDFDLDRGSIANKRPFFEVSEKGGYPDGLTVDSEGCIWVCHWDGWCITRISPKGIPIVRIEMPVPRPTSCHFGGSDLSTLFITSAISNLDKKRHAKSPQSGDLFAVSPAVPGLPEPKFAGTRVAHPLR